MWSSNLPSEFALESVWLSYAQEKLRLWPWLLLRCLQQRPSSASCVLPNVTIRNRPLHCCLPKFVGVSGRHCRKSLFSTDHFRVQFAFQLKFGVTLIMCGVTLSVISQSRSMPVIPKILWCTSPSHRYFCTKIIDGPNLTPFFIPFTKVMHLIERRKLLDSFAKYSKLREL